MSAFQLQLLGATQHETLDGLVSFVGVDASGSFGLLPNHHHIITALVFGLAQLRYVDGRREYLALPGAVACFADNRLTLSCRKFLRSEDYAQISQQLRDELVAEERDLSGLKRSLEEMEQSMLQRLWRLRRHEEAQ